MAGERGEAGGVSVGEERRGVLALLLLVGRRGAEPELETPWEVGGGVMPAAGVVVVVGGAPAVVAVVPLVVVFPEVEVDPRIGSLPLLVNCVLLPPLPGKQEPHCGGMTCVQRIKDGPWISHQCARPIY
jgi:hypothetical protein